MEMVNIYDVKIWLFQLVDKVVLGEDVVVSCNGKFLVWIIWLVVLKWQIWFGLLQGQLIVFDDFDIFLLDEVLVGFEGC